MIDAFQTSGTSPTSGSADSPSYAAVLAARLPFKKFRAVNRPGASVRLARVVTPASAVKRGGGRIGDKYEHKAKEKHEGHHHSSQQG